MNVANLEVPELIKELTLELTFNSLLPFNLNASFYMFNSETGMVTDTLLGESKVIKASFDGKPATTEVTLVVDRPFGKRPCQIQREFGFLAIISHDYE